VPGLGVCLPKFEYLYASFAGPNLSDVNDVSYTPKAHGRMEADIRPIYLGHLILFYELNPLGRAIATTYELWFPSFFLLTHD
jgi:hypothetical protein